MAAVNISRRRTVKMITMKGFLIKAENEYPIKLMEYAKWGGINLNLYFMHDLWAGRRIAEKMFKRHFDIGSRVDGFIEHLLVLNIPITLIDIRPMEAKIL